MATEAHCAYCFDSLATSLNGSSPLTLPQIEELWTTYTHASAASEEAPEEIEAPDPAKPAALRNLLNPSPASASSSLPSSTPSTPNPTTRASASSSRSSLPQSTPSEFPLFVTWNTISSRGHKNLRGCIGTFSGLELSDGLREYALTAAFEDRRFSPISARELPSLECGVTLLTNFQPAADPMAWEIGKHGLRISFTHRGQRYGSTYLPDVAKEQGWTKEETMVSLMRKAGWNGRKEEWHKVRDLSVVTYEGTKASLDYEDYRAWREWVDQHGA